MVERSISSAGNQLVVSVNLVKAALPSWPSSYPLAPFLQSLGKVSVVTVSILTTKKLCSRLVSYLPRLTGKRLTGKSHGLSGPRGNSEQW